MTGRARAILTGAAGLAAALVLATLAARTYSSWVEYYGDGPPYYGRTTNMDKWESPWSDLALSNGLGLVVLALLARVVVRLWRRPSGDAAATR